MADSKTRKVRGSQKLVANQGLKGMTLTQKDLNKFVGFSKRKGVKLVDWCILGQPAVDGACGKYQVSPKVASAFVKDLMRARPGIVIDIFPYGIPAVDGTLIGFRTGRVGSGWSGNG